MYHLTMDCIEDIRRQVDRLGFTGWGMSAVDPCAVPDGSGLESAQRTLFRSAISLFMAYELPPGHDPLRGGAYCEESLHETLVRAGDSGKARLDLLCARLEESGTGNWQVPRGQDRETLMGPFSEKRAAVRAGLGWIGKSSLLVTPGHGPRVRLFTVLLDIELPGPVRVTPPAGCGSCRQCVDACPGGFLTGAGWSPGAPREHILDPFGCNRSMVREGETLGRKHACGLCLLACPAGMEG